MTQEDPMHQDPSYTLLVYELIPECTKVYLIPNREIDEEALQVLTLCNYRYLEADDYSGEAYDALNAMNSALSNNPDAVAPKFKGTRWDRCWAKHEHMLKEGVLFPLIVPVTRFVHTGFML